MFKVSKEASAVFHTCRANWWKCYLASDQLILMVGETFSGRVKFFFWKKLSGIIYISPIAANFFSPRGFLDAPRNTFHITFHIYKQRSWKLLTSQRYFFMLYMVAWLLSVGFLHGTISRRWTISRWQTISKRQDFVQKSAKSHVFSWIAIPIASWDS